MGAVLEGGDLGEPFVVICGGRRCFMLAGRGRSLSEQWYWCQQKNQEEPGHGEDSTELEEAYRRGQSPFCFWAEETRADLGLKPKATRLGVPGSKGKTEADPLRG